MKLPIYPLLGLLLLASCSDDPNYGLTTGSTGSGKLSLADLELEVDNAENVVSRAVVDVVDTSSYIVTVTNAAGDVAYTASYADCKEIIDLPTATGYTITVESHAVEDVAWSAPYYLGSKTFEISDNQITQIGTVTAYFSNIRVSIRYSDDLKKYMADDCQTVVSCSESGASLAYTASESRSGYFRAADGSTTLGATFTGTVNGQTVTLTKAFEDVQAGQHRILNFTVRQGDSTVPDEYGTISIGDGLELDLTVTTEDVDGNITWEETGDSSAVRPGQEEAVTPDDDEDDPNTGDDNEEGITITAPGMSFTEVMTPVEGMDGRVYVTCPTGLSNLRVQIQTSDATFAEVLAQMNVPTDFDLAHMEEGDEMTNIGNLGFPMNEDILGKTYVEFDISAFVPLLNIYAGTHAFVLTVTDYDGSSLSRTLTFEVVK